MQGSISSKPALYYLRFYLFVVFTIKFRRSNAFSYSFGYAIRKLRGFFQTLSRFSWYLD